MTEPDYIVIRPAADLPAGFLPPQLDGLWLDRASMQTGPRTEAASDAGLGVGVAAATGRFEVRESDGAVAEVFEVRP